MNKTQNKEELYTCDNCSTIFPENKEFCPNCEIPITYFSENDFFICHICKSKNKLGETKCSYCCSFF